VEGEVDSHAEQGGDEGLEKGKGGDEAKGDETAILRSTGEKSVNKIMYSFQERTFGEGGAVEPEKEVGSVGSAVVFDH
jgi:hypothetical protein